MLNPLFMIFHLSVSVQYAKFDNTTHNVIAMYTNSVICACLHARARCLAPCQQKNIYPQSLLILDYPACMCACTWANLKVILFVCL